MYVGKIDKVTFGGAKKLNFQLHCCGCSKGFVHGKTKRWGWQLGTGGLQYEKCGMCVGTTCMQNAYITCMS